MDTHELILYATPTGALADGCAKYFEIAASLGGTVAQHYPPHCTLTGFFRRDTRRRAELITLVDARLQETGHPPDDAVEVIALAHHDDWIGLELTSEWLLEWTQKFAAEAGADPGEDALRLKTWLHLSLAYGVDDVAPFRRETDSAIDPAAPAQWRIGLWERHGGSWSCLTDD